MAASRQVDVSQRAVAHLLSTKAPRLALLLLLTLPVGVSAQSSSPDIEDVRKNAQLQAGPFYVSPSLLLKELGVDTNVFNEPDAEKSDFTFTLAPRVDVWVPVARRALFTTRAATDLVWYAKYDTERSVDPQASVRADIFVRRLRLFGEAAHQSSRQRLNYEIDLRSRHLRNDVTVGAEVKVTPRLSIEAAGRRSGIAFDADAVFHGTSLEHALNRTTTSAVLAARHRATPLTTFVAAAEQLRDEFEFSPERDSESVRATAGLEFKPRALISGSAMVGFRRFVPEHQAVPDYTGLVAHLGLSYRLLGATTFGVSYTRDLQYSFEPFQPYYVLNGVGGSVRQALGSRFDVLVSADRVLHDYRNLLLHPGGGAVLPLGAREDVVLVGAASLGFRLGRDARIGAGVSYQERRSSTASVRNYTTVRFATTVSYGLK